MAGVLDGCRAARGASCGWFDPWAMPGGVDPTGYVKGWAAQRALEALRVPGVAGAMVNAAGDIASFGGPEPGQPFRVGILDPWSRARLACVVELVDALATSGTYERATPPHRPVLGPADLPGRLGQRVRSRPALADALATALAVAGPAGLRFVDAQPGYEGLVIEFDGTRQWTAGFPFAWSASPGRRSAP